MVELFHWVLNIFTCVIKLTKLKFYVRESRNLWHFIGVPQASPWACKRAHTLLKGKEKREQ